MQHYLTVVGVFCDSGIGLWIGPIQGLREDETIEFVFRGAMAAQDAPRQTGYAVEAGHSDHGCHSV